MQETIVEVKTQLLTTSVEKLQDLAKEYLPLLEDTTRTAIFVAFEGYLADMAKEEHAVKLLQALLEKLKKGTIVDKSTVKEETTDSKAKDIKESKETHEVLKTLRREFKVSGSIGDGPNCIGYSSFIRQIESGKNHGYSERDLVDGIIRAIQAGSKLRGYLEGRYDISLSKVQSIVRAAYKEKAATELYQELCALKQGSKETLQEFLFRALELKQKISFACKESDLPTYDDKLVMHQLRHSLSTGIRNDGIRTESLALIKSFTSDENLIQGMNEIERRHVESDEKLKVKKDVSRVTVEESEILKELKALKIEVNQLKTQKSCSETDNKMPSQNPTRRVRRRRACENCTRSGSNCRHCWNCGAGDHLSRNCSKNAERPMSKGDHWPPRS